MAVGQGVPNDAVTEYAGVANVVGFNYDVIPWPPSADQQRSSATHFFQLNFALAATDDPAQYAENARRAPDAIQGHQNQTDEICPSVSAVYSMG